jgi:hypothetical protein
MVVLRNSFLDGDSYDVKRLKQIALNNNNTTTILTAVLLEGIMDILNKY